MSKVAKEYQPHKGYSIRITTGTATSEGTEAESEFDRFKTLTKRLVNTRKPKR